MPALGEEFRSAREARGLSLSDVAERLHIRSVYLGAIEEEDWSVIGAPVYVRGFMRTYARFLGLDAEAAVARFTAIVPSAAPPTRAAVAQPQPEERPGERRGPSIAALAAILVAVALIVFVGYEFYQYRAEQPAGSLPVADASLAPSAALPAAAVPGPDASAEPAATTVAEPSPAAVPSPPKHGLSLRLTQKSWLRVAVDGTVAVEGVFPAGTAKSFDGHAIEVRVGNAGGVRYTLDGRDRGAFGADGDVVERRFVISGE
jgi:cytoskeletal protein RodZ